MRRIIRVILSVLIVVYTITGDKTLAFNDDERTYCLKINYDMVLRVTGKEVEKESTLSMTIDKENNAMVTFEYSNNAYTGYCVGEPLGFDLNKGKGYYTYFTGELFSGKEKVYVDIDAYYINDEMFATFTYYNDKSCERSILCYGCITEDIEKLIDKYNEMFDIETKMNNDSIITSNENMSYDAAQVRSDYTRHFQGYNSTYFGNYVVGQISVIHQNNLQNGNSAEVDVKINTNTGNVNSYLVNNAGVSSATMVYTYQVETTVYGSEADWDIPPGGYEPVNSSTSYTIPLFFYAGELLGIQSVDVTISTTSTSAQRYHNSSANNYGKITWIICKTTGFNSSISDGTYNSNKGFPFNVDFRYNGNVSYNTLTYISSKAKITYKYKYYDSGNIITATISTSYFYKITNITVEP
ncbi:MAG: hypothetical protein IJG59_06415 [Erysipelotrichaceae bacterium]|nr:hypothetical protein [Erysipelotrichaceae bacterium]